MSFSGNRLIVCGYARAGYFSAPGKRYPGMVAVLGDLFETPAV